MSLNKHVIPILNAFVHVIYSKVSGQSWIFVYITPKAHC